jgi:hypothetical protein
MVFAGMHKRFERPEKVHCSKSAVDCSISFEQGHHPSHSIHKKEAADLLSGFFAPHATLVGDLLVRL